MFFFIFGRSALVKQLSMKSFSSLCASVLNFAKTGSLVFSNIVHNDSWPWYLATDEARLKKKKNGGLEAFRHFFEFG